MNLPRHQQAFRDLYQQLQDGGNRKRHRRHQTLLYEEYFAVNDLPAEFYLETVAQVFQEYRLAKAASLTRARRKRIEPAAIRRTAPFTVEG